MNLKVFSLLFVTILLTVFTAAQRPRPQTLDERVRAELTEFKGKVWIYAKNLDTGKDYALRADEQVLTASMIKLPIMAEVFRQVAEGKVKWDDQIELTKEKKQGGSGILSEFSDGTKIDLKTAVNLMIVVSDNTATNLVLDKVGLYLFLRKFMQKEFSAIALLNISNVDSRAVRRPPRR